MTTTLEVMESVDVRNRETSAREVAAWLANPPRKAFVYVKPYPNVPYQGNITTWPGEVLGRCSIGQKVYAGFGFHTYRRALTVYGTNGRTYHGWFYESSGDYARITMHKRHAVTGEPQTPDRED